MRNLLSTLQDGAIWGLFFASSVYGHVALKFATGTSATYDVRRAFDVLLTFWGFSAIVAWTLSSFFWTLLLTKNSVITANTISAFRYVLICLAAIIWLREALQWRDVVGILLVSAGVWFLAK